MIARLIRCVIGLLVYWAIDWLTDWLIIYINQCEIANPPPFHLQQRLPFSPSTLFPSLSPTSSFQLTWRQRHVKDRQTFIVSTSNVDPLLRWWEFHLESKKHWKKAFKRVDKNDFQQKNKFIRISSTEQTVYGRDTQASQKAKQNKNSICRVCGKVHLRNFR